MENDWLKDLQEAQRRIRGLEAAISGKAEALSFAGIAKELREDLWRYADRLHEIEILVSRGTSGTVDEHFHSARDATYNMLGVALAIAEREGGKV